MPVARRYEMSARERARAATREEILDAAEELFTPAWFDEVTLADVARRAGVSQQTVVNHFGSKIDLYLTGIEERIAPRLADARAGAEPGDVRGIVASVVSDYEESGDGTIRIVSLAGRLEELQEVVRRGRAWHRAWVEDAFRPQLAKRRGAPRDRALTLLVTVLDVTTWKALRRDEGLDRAETEVHLRTLVEGILVA
jgi:AcrR family transcriptional regulator